MADPTRERCPDYALPEFDDERVVFTVDGKTEEEAVEILRALWTIHHARSVEDWENQREANAEEERQRHEQAGRAAEQRRALQLEEEEEEEKEEKKGPKDIGRAEAIAFELLIRTLDTIFPESNHVILHGDNTGIVEGWRVGRHRNRAVNSIFKYIRSFLS